MGPKLALTGLGTMLAILLVVWALSVWPEDAAAADGSWTGNYFNNRDLMGPPVLTRDDGDVLDFWWEDESPGPGVPAEVWSARWTRTDQYQAGLYRFTVTADDGVFVGVDGVGILDEWFDQKATTYVVDLYLASGSHDVRVDFYNAYYAAVIEVDIWLMDPGVAGTAVSTQGVPSSTSIAGPTSAPPTAATTHTAPGSTSTRAARTSTAGPSTPATTTTPGPTATPVVAIPPPTLMCAWQLPDMRSLSPGMQYADTSGAHDDDPLVKPDADGAAANGIQPACGLSASGTSQSDEIDHMAQVAPNPDNLPERRRLELWAAASHPSGLEHIAGAFFAVYDPAGTQVATVIAERAVCPAAAGPMFQAATGTGQVGAGAINDPSNGLASSCTAEDVALYRGEYLLGNVQPCGEYTVVAVAMNNEGYATSLRYQSDVLCVVALRIDFEVVDWGPIAPGVMKVTDGDDEFLPGGATKPTVRNAGNDAAEIRAQFSELIGENLGGKIVAFLLCIEPDARPSICQVAEGDGSVNFGGSASSILCAAGNAAAGFGVVPPHDVVDDQYGGTLQLVALHRPGRCFGIHYLP